MSCYIDSTSARTLPSALSVVGGASTMTVATCLDACAKKGLMYCGQEYYSECYGSATGPDAGLALAGDPLAQGCSFACSGNATEACGGSNRILVYVNNGTAT